MLKLVLPSPEYKDQILSYKEEFLANGDSMDGTAGLDRTGSFEEWYEKWKLTLHEETVPAGWVDSTTYLAVDENDVLVGMIDVRHRLNDFLLKHCGHIGYSIRKSQRRKGYATEMLALALKECPQFGIERALVTCAKQILVRQERSRKTAACWKMRFRMVTESHSATGSKCREQVDRDAKKRNVEKQT